MFDRRLLQICPESRRYIFAKVLLQWLELWMNAGMIGLIALTAQEVLENRIQSSVVSLRLVLLLLIVALRWFTTKGATRMSYLASRTVKRVLRTKIYEKLLRLGTGYRAHVSTAELVQESVEGVEQLETYFGQYLPQFFYAFLAPVTLFFLFGAAGSFAVGGVLLLCVPLIPGAIIIVQKIAKRLFSKYWTQYTQLGNTFLENLQGLTTLKIYGADAAKNEQMNRESEAFRIVTMKVLTMQLNSIIVMDLFAYGGAALGIGLACSALAQGTLALGSCLFMILLSADFFLPMRRLGSYFHIAMNGMAASEKIFQFLNKSEPPKKTEVLPKEGGAIRLAGVDFCYTESQPVLRDLSLEIPARGLVGIVGESGSGKSTIAALLMGRQQAQRGCLQIAGKEISILSERSLLQTLTYVGSDSVFFKGSVRENLQPAAPGAEDARLWEVLSACQLTSFFRRQQGLDTTLLENAQNLSGGQRQRLALARALLHDSPIYLFDEATGNIDVESEEAILKNIYALAGTKAVILITHRLANVVNAERIYCLREGRVAGNGTHEDLLQTCETYRSLWATQQALENFRKEVSTR